ncbi:MAG: hypothetical protein PHH63_08590, partial [Bacteroidales bacterium]|nr:hypothetical protein [Bacteroidales bacterium]
VDSIQKTFSSEMLLTSDLKGFIETPGYYFNNPYDSICKQLDLLLLTHGWRGYSWDDVTRKSFTHRPDTSFTLSGTVSNLLLKPSARRRVSLFVQGGKMIAKETKTDQNGKFFFKDLDIKETSMVRINLEKDKRSRLGFGIELDTIHRKPYFPIVPLENYLYESEEMDSLLFTFRENQEENDSYLDSLRKIKGVHLLKEVTVMERKKIPNSYNTYHEPDMVIDSVQLGRYDAYTNVIEVLKAEVPGFKKDFGSQRDARGIRVFRQYEYYNISGAPVIFIIDAESINNSSGTFLPKEPGGVAVHADRTEYAVMKRTEYILEGLAGSDISGIEVVTTEDNLYYERNHAFIFITTKKGQGPRDMVRSRTYFTELRGGSIPKSFYVPKYYPKEAIDQINYDGKHVYYWNPALLTNGEQDVEVSFPVGAYMKGNLQLEIEGTDLNGHIGTQRQEIKLNR